MGVSASRGSAHLSAEDDREDGRVGGGGRGAGTGAVYQASAYPHNQGSDWPSVRVTPRDDSVKGLLVSESLKAST